MRSATLVTVVLLALSAGCSRPDPVRVRVYPVEGQLIVSGMPAENAHVAFHPLDANATRGIYPVGLTRADGRFQLTSYAANDGAPAGEYIVTVFWPNHDGPCDDLTHDRLLGAYTDRHTSSLRGTIRPDDPNAISIRADVGSRGWNLPRKSGGDQR